MKEVMEKKHDNSAGIVSVVLGILSIVFFLIPVLSLILAIIGLIFAFVQKKKMRTAWSTAGLWLNGIGILTGVVWNIYYIKGILSLAQQYQQQIQGLQGTANAAGAYNYGAN